VLGSFVAVEFTFVLGQRLDRLLVILQFLQHFKRVCRLGLLLKHHDEVDLRAWVSIEMGLQIALHLGVLFMVDHNVDVKLVICFQVLDLISDERCVGDWQAGGGISISRRMQSLRIFLVQDY
jgi:hypothetical protein